MDNLSTIERMKNTPPEDNGFICYCDACEAQYGSHMVDDETGLIYCDCGEEFQPVEE